MSKAEVGKRYMHYKGKEYIVLAMGKHTETLEDFVIYEAQYYDSESGNKHIWVRPKKMFEEKIEYNGQMIDRFLAI